MPPPCCMVSAPSCSARKIPGIEVLDRSHHEAIEQRHVARRSRSGLDAAARQRTRNPAGWQRNALPKRPFFCSTAASARATRRHVSAIVALGAASIGVPIFRLPDVMGNIGWQELLMIPPVRGSICPTLPCASDLHQIGAIRNAVGNGRQGGAGRAGAECGSRGNVRSGRRTP